MNRRNALKSLLPALWAGRAWVAAPSVATVIGHGSPGLSDQQVNGACPRTT